MKRIFAAIICCFTILGSLAGCSGSSDEAKDKQISELEQQVSNLQSQLEELKTVSSNVSTPPEVSSAGSEPQTSENELDKAKVILTKKGESPKDSDNWQFSSYVTLEFKIENGFDKEIKGIQGIAYFKDMFGEEIIHMGADFTDAIAPGKSIKVDDLSYEINEYKDDDMKLYNTDYDKLQFDYKPTKIVFKDGTTLSAEKEEK